MARPAKKVASKKSTARRPGRPSNASIAADNDARQRFFIQTVAAAASAAASGAVQAALADSGMVTTLGVPQGSQSGQSGNATASTGQSASTPRTRSNGSTTAAKRPPGRRPDPNSNLSKARVIYADTIGKLDRKDIVAKMVTDLTIGKDVANTYYHTIHRDNGGKSSRAPRGARTQTRKAA